MIVTHAPLAPHVDAWFTGRERPAASAELADGPWGPPGNLAHRRPHRPGDLAEARGEVGRLTSTVPDQWHLMRQVHGDSVGIVDQRTPPGAEFRDVDALVTVQAGRPLAVQVADCVPALIAGERAIAAVHAGRAGVASGVASAAVAAMRGLGDDGQLRAVLGPAIGGCCYEVPPELQADVGASHPAALSTTTWGTPSLDLPAAVTAELEEAGVVVEPAVAGCTRCDPEQRWFSHRADPASGRQIGLIVRRGQARWARS